MKRIYLMSVLFFFCILGPNLLFFLFRGNGEEANTENRELASFPAFSPEKIDAFPAAVEAYVNDHAAFRGPFLSLNAGLNLALFHHADSLDVITGTDGWYFYSAGSSVEDYLGVNRFSADQLSEIAARVEETAAYFEERGTQFLLLIAPNKESVYREYLPGDFPKDEKTTRRSELIAYLQQHTSIPVVDPYPAMRSDRSVQWYYQTDTHWNDAGGFLASQLLIKACGGTPTPISEVTVSWEPHDMGDLANLFHMPPSLNREQNAVISGYYDGLSMDFTDVNGDGNLVHVRTPDAPDPRRIAIYRDSFGSALLTGLSHYFQETDFYHWQHFDASLLNENPPDLLVYQVVERDLGRISEDLARLTAQD